MEVRLEKHAEGPRDTHIAFAQEIILGLERLNAWHRKLNQYMCLMCSSCYYVITERCQVTSAYVTMVSLRLRFANRELCNECMLAL